MVRPSAEDRSRQVLGVEAGTAGDAQGADRLRVRRRGAVPVDVAGGGSSPISPTLVFQVKQSRRFDSWNADPLSARRPNPLRSQWQINK
jgi:hypothetical protein